MKQATLSPTLRARASKPAARACASARATWSASGPPCSPIARRFAADSPSTRRRCSRDGPARRDSPLVRGARAAAHGRAADEDDDEPYALDAEDEALLLRIHQLQRGPLQGAKGPLDYHHLMIDEVQDFAPVELAVLLDCTTVRDDRSPWPATPTRPSRPSTASRAGPSHAGPSGSAARMRRAAAHQLPLDPADRGHAPCTCSARSWATSGRRSPRSGAEVERLRLRFVGRGQRVSGAHALRDLMHREPLASVALIARHPEQARLYYEALSAAEVPALRLVADQDFCFRPGIDVTDVTQTKGLEFDIVILLEANAGVVPGKRSRASLAPRGHDPRGPPAVGHVHGHAVTALARIASVADPGKAG